MTFATLTATDVAAIVATVVSVLAVAAVTLVLATLVRAVNDARAAVQALRDATEPLVAELASLTDQAAQDFTRVDDLIGSAEALAAAVDSAARVGYLTVGRPVIKTVALAKGTSRAARRLRPPKAG